MFPVRAVGAAASAFAISLSAAPVVEPTEAGRSASSTPCQAPSASAVARDWQRIGFRTVYTEQATPIPVGVLYLAFSSLAMNGASHLACRDADTSPVAAVAVAAHHVLVEYFPDSRTSLDDDLTASLAEVPDGPAKVSGIRIGDIAAETMVATLAAIEFEAFHARIWSGLHFRDAMQDAYRIGHASARRVMRALDLQGLPR